MPQTASEGLKALPNLVAELRKRIDEIEQECSQANYKWIGLGKVGGQRQDSAAEFLKSVRREVKDLAKFVNRVDEQMAAVIADPWGDDRTDAESEAAKKQRMLVEQNLVIL
jgi:hypothetical protein